jgi:PII-like signaling protein
MGLGGIMKIDNDGCLLRILIGEGSKHKGKPLYEWLVLKARELELAGATVTRGIMGFGANSRIHTAKILRLSEDLPVVIEIVDSREKIEIYLATVEGNIEGGLATIEKADVRFYRSRQKKAFHG